MAKKLTIHKVDEMLRTIEKYKSDPEIAHRLEDELFIVVLTHIANSTCELPALCAASALVSQNIKFPRWYA